MPRPIDNPDQKIDAYILFSTVGLRTATAIARALQGKYELDAKLPRTVRRWMADWDDRHDEFQLLEKPFAWHDLDHYGLPWEATPFLLEMAKMLSEHRHPIMVVIDSEGRRLAMPPTWREIRWAWRIHQAFGGVDAMTYGYDVSPEGKWNNYLRDVEGVSAAFVSRELAAQVFGESLDFKDLDAFLLYRPWRDQPARFEYLRDIEEGLIPACVKTNLLTNVRALKEANIDVKRDVTITVWPDPNYPGLLPSEIAHEEWKQEQR